MANNYSQLQSTTGSQVNNFLFQDTTATQKIFSLKKRIRAVAGGTSASKTISILVWLIDYCQSNHNKIATVVSESFPHLDKGAMRDFEQIMKDRNYWNDSRWNKTAHTYNFETDSQLEFTSMDSYGKAHGPRRHILFANECNNLAYNIVDQLITRTKEIVWLDWNPTSEFWFYTEMLGKRDDVDFITLTYKDNEALDEATIKEIESHRGNAQWWRVYGEGQLGEVEERIYTGWEIIDTIPHEARLERYGLDFGYTNDPSALVGIYKWNGAYIIDEVAYQKGLSNRQIADVLLNVPRALVIADSAEPKSIDEIKGYGITIVGSQKGQGSVNQGIAYVQSQKIFLTRRSVNTLKEYRNYLWLKDKDNKILNEPSPIWDHSMASIRYGLDSFRNTGKWKPSDVGGVMPFIPNTLA